MTIEREVGVIVAARTWTEHQGRCAENHQSETERDYCPLCKAEDSAADGIYEALNRLESTRLPLEDYLRVRLINASPLPWRNTDAWWKIHGGPGCSADRIATVHKASDSGYDTSRDDGKGDQRVNSNLIVSAVNALPELLATIDALRAQLAKAEREREAREQALMCEAFQRGWDGENGGDDTVQYMDDMGTREWDKLFADVISAVASKKADV